MSVRDRASGLTTEEALPPPKLVVLLGRGSRGKSTLGMWMAERARIANRPLIIADIDQSIATLTSFFEGVAVPTAHEDDDVAAWLNTLFEAQMEQHTTVLLDTGGGDTLWTRYSSAYRPSDLLEASGVQTVAVHVLGPSKDDLSQLQECESTGSFAPKRVILVRNEANVQGNRSTDLAFEDIISHPVYRRAVERGAKEALMPRLRNMNRLVASDLLFNKAATTANLRVNVGGTEQPFGMFNQHIVRTWLLDMDRNFAELTAWLP